MAPNIRRIYEPAQPTDGARVLVDRIWPRGISKERAALTLWLKDVGPTTDLRKWFNHEPSRWDEFRSRYEAELDANPEAVETLRSLMAKGPVTLLYSAHDEDHNQARVLQTYLSRK